MDRSEQDDFYRVSRFLNQPKRTLGCTMDELIPALIFLGVGLFLSWLITGLVLSAGWILTLKHFKRKYGASFLLVNLYWYTSKEISKNAFKNTPPSEYKFWMR